MMLDVWLAREFWHRGQYWEAVKQCCWSGYLVFETYCMPKRSMRRVQADFQQGKKL